MLTPPWQCKTGIYLIDLMGFWQLVQVGVASCTLTLFTPVNAADNTLAPAAPSQKASAAMPGASVPALKTSESSHAGVRPEVRPNTQKDPGPEKEVDSVTRILAILGICLGGVNLFLTVWKIRRDRRLSVEDDFWFRKIIAPVSIEPLIKSVMALLHEMPDARSPQEAKQSYAAKITTEFQKLYVSMQPLALIEETWPRMVVERLQSCEDLMTNRIAQLIVPPEGFVADAIDLQSEVLSELNAVLRKIKDGHLKR